MVFVALLSAWARPLSAQNGDDTPLRLSVSPDDGHLRIRIGNLFEDPSLTDALHSGLPLRIRIVAELWKDGFFDSQKGRGEWRASVIYDPLEQRYRVATGSSQEVPVDSVEGLAGALQARFSLPLKPPGKGRYYYLAQVEVETLSMTDLEELQRWLKGDLASAVSGNEKVETAVGRGVRRMLVRMLGLPTKRFRVKSHTFDVDAEGHVSVTGESDGDGSGGSPGPEGPSYPKTARLTVSVSMRSRSGSTPMPTPSGTAMRPSETWNSGVTRSRSQ